MFFFFGPGRREVYLTMPTISTSIVPVAIFLKTLSTDD